MNSSIKRLNNSCPEPVHCTGRLQEQKDKETPLNVKPDPEIQTGGRIASVRDWLGHQTFMMTYGDGVGDIDIRRLVDFHHRHGKLATITAVRPPARIVALERKVA